MGARGRGVGHMERADGTDDMERMSDMRDEQYRPDRAASHFQDKV